MRRRFSKNFQRLEMTYLLEKAEGLEQALLEIGKEEDVIKKGYMIRDEVLTKMSDFVSYVDERPEIIDCEVVLGHIRLIGDILFSVRSRRDAYVCDHGIL